MYQKILTIRIEHSKRMRVEVNVYLEGCLYFNNRTTGYKFFHFQQYLVDIMSRIWYIHVDTNVSYSIITMIYQYLIFFKIITIIEGVSKGFKLYSDKLNTKY